METDRSDKKFRIFAFLFILFWIIIGISAYNDLNKYFANQEKEDKKKCIEIMEGEWDNKKAVTLKKLQN